MTDLRARMRKAREERRRGDSPSARFWRWKDDALPKGPEMIELLKGSSEMRGEFTRIKSLVSRIVPDPDRPGFVMDEDREMSEAEVAEAVLIVRRIREFVKESPLPHLVGPEPDLPMPEELVTVAEVHLE